MMRPLLVRSALRSARMSSLRPLCHAQRFSIKAEAASTIKPLGLDASKLSIEKTGKPKGLSKPEDLVFGREFTDHMLAIEWNQDEGWLEPKITPYQNLSLDPATCVFHYAFECFEGMKAYKDQIGRAHV